MNGKSNNTTIVRITLPHRCLCVTSAAMSTRPIIGQTTEANMTLKQKNAEGESTTSHDQRYRL